MTIEQFLEQLPSRLTKVRAEILYHHVGIWPTGWLLRVKVPPPATVLHPGVLDLVGAYYYAEKGVYVNVMQSAAAALTLGLGADDTLRLLDASDKGTVQLTDLETLRLRRALIEVLSIWAATDPHADPLTAEE